ncbi:MAG: preprotein translocase, SecG subunit [Pseudomonadota bacterium]|jgi:preprotein translocase subunit SecG
MYTAVLTLHVLLAIVLVILVLLQQGKGADAGAIMGAGGANTVFGVGGASSLLVRMTTFIAIAFMLTSVGLVKLALNEGGRGSVKVDAVSGSVMGGIPEGQQQPAAPAADQKTEQKSEVPVPPAVDGANVPK